MDHRATISADFPTNGRKVKILSHKGLFFAASRCLPHERTFSPGPSGTPNFDTTGVKIFFLWVDFDPSEIRNMWKQLPTQWVGTSGPLGHKLDHKFVPTGHKVKIFSVGCLVSPLPVAYQLERKILQENPKKQASSTPTTWGEKFSWRKAKKSSS
jgi:hypothetical protein